MKDKPPSICHYSRGSLLERSFSFVTRRVYRELDPEVDHSKGRMWYWSTVWGGDVACWRCGNSTKRGSQCEACQAENCMFLLYTTDRTNPLDRIFITGAKRVWGTKAWISGERESWGISID